MFLELLEEWIVAGGKAHKWRSEHRLGLWHAEAVVRGVAEPSDRLAYPGGLTRAVGRHFCAHALSLHCAIQGGSSPVA
jgi:hypothetical protein